MIDIKIVRYTIDNYSFIKLLDYIYIYIYRRCMHLQCKVPSSLADIFNGAKCIKALCPYFFFF